MRTAVRRAVTAAGWIGTAAAPLATHWYLATGRGLLLAAALSTCQVITIGAVALGSLAPGRRGRAYLLLFGIGLLILRLAPGVRADSLVAASGVSHAVIYLSLLTLFGTSLRLGQDDLITSLARRLRGGLTSDMMAYTHRVTIAWCAFFAAQLATSALLFVLAPRATWSLFVNVLDFPLVVVMFATEYSIRRLRFRNYPHISIRETVRTFARGPSAPDQP